MRIYLQFAATQSPRTRARLEYAFRLFCVIYGHTPLTREEQSASADLIISYATHPQSAPVVRLCPAYDSRFVPLPEGPGRYKYGDEATVLRCTRYSETPDWLGEIFVWVSCLDEYTSPADGTGRISFDNSYLGRYRLNPRIPYAAVAMKLLQWEISKVIPRSTVAPPAVSGRHLIVNTHDVDYVPTGRSTGILRLLENACISLFHGREFSLVWEQLRGATALALSGKDPLDQIARLLRAEKERGLRSSYYFLCRRRHRRDGNYDFESPSVASCMREVQRQAEIGVHGSYCSLDSENGLAEEFQLMQDAGFRARGSRQHWLRFTLDRLIPQIEKAGADYDCSLGWPDVAGFRGGACFAYPPYNFASERPAHFLELPLVVMDHAIRLLFQRGEDAYKAVSEVLSASRRYGWGGISVLWHPTAFGREHMPAPVGELFWRLLDESEQMNDKYISAADFMDEVAKKYVAAGLPIHTAAPAEAERSTGTGW